MKANEKNLENALVTKRFLNMVAKFNEDIKAFAEESGEEEATLYEDILTSFTLSNVRIEGNYLVYDYEGREEKDILFRFSKEVKEGEEAAAIDEGLYYNWIDEAKEQIKFWRACLRRAKKYLAMSAEDLETKEEAALYGYTEEEGEEEANQEEAAEESAAALAVCIANQEAEEAAEESADKAESAAEAAAKHSGNAEYFAAKVTTAADAKEAAKYQEAAAVAADMAESFADKAESAADAAAAFAAKVTTAADAETKKAAEISANRAAKAADMATKAAEEARRAANQAAAEAFAAFAAPESGEARKADILAKLAAAYDTTKNKSIAITLNNYIHTAEGIDAEEFTKALYYWYIGALLRFGLNIEAAAPESVRAAEESETAAEYQEAAAPESGEAAADLLKMSAAVAFGFVGFYLTFAIFGI